LSLGYDHHDVRLRGRRGNAAACSCG